MPRCDICSDELADRQDGTAYIRERVLGSPQYWEVALKDFVDPFFADIFNKNDGASAFVERIITSHSDFLVCAKCNRMLEDDQSRVADYRLQKWYSLMQSPAAKGKEGLEAVLIIIGTVYERLSGKWPGWIGTKEKLTRDKHWSTTA